MHITVKRNSQILDFDKFNDFYAVLCSHFCFLIEKNDNKGKNPSELIEAHIHGSTDFLSTLKMLAKEATYFDVFYM